MLIAQGIIVLDLELRDGSRIFSPSSCIRFLVTHKKSLKLNSLGEMGVFWATPFFGLSGYVQCEKSVYLYTYLTVLDDFCVILYIT